MQLGIEIFTMRSLPLREGDSFSTELQINGAALPAACGHDQYELNTVILPQKRLAGTGREYIYAMRDLICGLGNLEARPASFVDLPEDSNSLSLRLETNRLLDYRELSLLLELEIHWHQYDREQFRRISLYHPDLNIDWIERGTYHFDLTAICDDLFADIA